MHGMRVSIKIRENILKISLIYADLLGKIVDKEQVIINQINRKKDAKDLIII